MDNQAKQKLEQHHKAEIADHEEYLQLANEMESMGYHHCAGMLRDIAHEEHTHADLIAYMMEEPR